MQTVTKPEARILVRAFEEGVDAVPSENIESVFEWSRSALDVTEVAEAAGVSPKRARGYVTGLIARGLMAYQSEDAMCSAMSGLVLTDEGFELAYCWYVSTCDEHVDPLNGGWMEAGRYV